MHRSTRLLLLSSTLAAKSCDSCDALAFQQVIHCRQQQGRRAKASALGASDVLVSVQVAKKLSQQEAEDIIETCLFPSGEHTRRMNAGRDAQGLREGTSSVVEAGDPRMQYTYGEFPLRSFDTLIDMSLDELQSRRGTIPDSLRLVDLGSGCGRLVLYAALSRGWNVNGIEIGRELHTVATNILSKGTADGYFTSAQLPNEGVISLHLGAADTLTDVLGSADIIFAYSTVFPAAKDFNVEISALVLSPAWSEMLAKACRDECVVVTTDRALDPQFGWELVARREIENPEVFGSTGYVHILNKSKQGDMASSYRR
mmetsp:Transcript_14216/g.30857  ORF Transcript_14216/g.30857 Transcript_14216/m.30857 type:complete len:314 (+) Transcript_14216:172-1113(+)